MKYRLHQCWPCKHTWKAPVVLSAITGNLSGEANVYCPICNKKSSYAAPVCEDSQMRCALSLTMEVSKGVTIYETCEAAVQLADFANTYVHFEFNDQQFTAQPGMQAQTLVDAYSEKF